MIQDSVASGTVGHKRDSPTQCRMVGRYGDGCIITLVYNRGTSVCNLFLPFLIVV